MGVYVQIVAGSGIFPPFTLNGLKSSLTCTAAAFLSVRVPKKGFGAVGVAFQVISTL